MLSFKVSHPPAYYWIFLLFSLAGAVLVFLLTSRWGIGLSPDSANYIAASRSLLSGHGYLRFDGTPFVRWPPLYPTLLAGIGLTGFDLVPAARYFHAVIFAAIIFLFGIIFITNLKSRPLALIGCLCILFSPVILPNVIMALADSLFALLLVIFLFQFQRFLQSNTTKSLYFLALIAALATLTRYPGVILISSFAISITIFSTDKIPFHIRATRALHFAVISILPLTVWLIHNLLVSSTIVNFTALPTSHTVFDNFIKILNAMTIWFLPERTPIFVRFLFLVMILCLVTYVVMKQHDLNIILPHALIPIFLFIFVVSYYILIIIMHTITTMDPIGDRMLMPAYLFFIVLLFIGLDFLLAFKHHNIKLVHIVKSAVFIFCGVWLMLSIYRTVDFAKVAIKDGAGVFSSTMWRESAVIEYVRKNNIPGRIFSNYPSALYILADSPAYLCPNEGTPLSTFKELLSTDKYNYLVWFADKERPFCFTFEKIDSIFALDILAELGDGAVYHFH